jgi:hypothetical protein
MQVNPGVLVLVPTVEINDTDVTELLPVVIPLLTVRKGDVTGLLDVEIPGLLEPVSPVDVTTVYCVPSLGDDVTAYPAVVPLLRVTGPGVSSVVPLVDPCVGDDGPEVVPLPRVTGPGVSPVVPVVVPCIADDGPDVAPVVALPRVTGPGVPALVPCVGDDGPDVPVVTP